MTLTNKFNCILPVEFEKSVDKQTGKKNYRFRAIASDDSEDTDKEILNPNGFEFNDFLAHGFVNYNHGLKNSPKALVGEPSVAFVNDKNQFIVDGFLYGNSKVANDIIETAEMLEKSGSTRKFKLSIEGQPLKRSEINPRKIEKARITGLAITLQPKNVNTLFSLLKGEQSDDFVNYEYEPIEKSDANGSMSPEYLVDITDKDKGVRVTMDKSLTIKIEKSMTTSSPSGKAMIKESLEKKPKNLFEFQKAVVTISKGHELGMVPDEMIEKARMHKYLRKEGDKYIYKESEEKEKKEENLKVNDRVIWNNELSDKKEEGVIVGKDEKGRFEIKFDNGSKAYLYPDVLDKVKSSENKEVDYNKYTVHAVSNEDVGVEMKKWRNMGYTEVKKGNSSNGKTQILISKVKKKDINPNK